MKKTLMILVMTAATFGSVMAQEEVGLGEIAGKKYTVVTNNFWHNWFVEASATTYKWDNAGMSLALGKWFSPEIGVRTLFNMFSAKRVEEHVMFNLSNIWCGYNAKRVYNIIPYVGAGAALGKANGLTLTAGVNNRFRLSPRLSIGIDLSYGVRERAGEVAYKHDHSFNAEIGLTLNLGKNKWKHEPDVQGMQEMYQMEIDALKATIQDMEGTE